MRPLLISLIVFCGWLPCNSANARELTVAEADLVSARIVGVQPLPGGEMAAVLLQLDDGVLPIIIGMTEALAIERARRGVQSPRPLTHDLLSEVITSADLRMQRLVIDELTDQGSYLAALELQPAGGGTVRRIDSRPSDGMALAVRSGADIVIARQVVEKARAAEKEASPDRPMGADPIQT